MAGNKNKTLKESLEKATESLNALREEAEKINVAYKDKLDDDSQVSELIQSIFKDKYWALYDVGYAEDRISVIPVAKEYLPEEYQSANQVSLREIIEKGTAEKIEPNRRYMILPYDGDNDVDNLVSCATFSWLFGKFPRYIDVETKVNNEDPEQNALRINGAYILDSLIYDGKNLNLMVDKDIMQKVKRVPNTPLYNTTEVNKLLEGDKPTIYLAKENIGYLKMKLSTALPPRYYKYMKAEFEKEQGKKQEKQESTPEDGHDVKY